VKIKELIEKGNIKEQAVDENEIRGSMRIAERFVERAEGNLEMDFFDVAFLLAYNAMFHAARALLFKAGYKERTHFGLISALKELNKNDKEIIGCMDILDAYRMTRHAVQYSGELSNELDAVQAIKDAKKIIEIIRSKLKAGGFY
jgi:uncharacterized protein (UPF0332 family)